MSHIAMLLTNPYRPDPRVEREARALVKAGHRVTLVCWDRAAELPPRETHNGLDIIRVQSVRSAYGSGWRQLFYLPRFWRMAVRIVAGLQPNAVHCHDLDTLFVGWRLKQRTACRLVYDAHEHYPAMMSLYLPRVMVNTLAVWERYLIRHADAVVTASTVLRDEFLQTHRMPVITLGNFQDMAPYQAVSAAEAQVLRAKLGVPDGKLLVAYIGGFSKNRILVPFIEAARLLPAVEFHLWGDGAQRTEVEAATARYPNAHYHGWLGADDLPIHFRAADVIYYCLRLDYPGAQYNAPNTLSQAMAAGRPIIANRVGDLGRIVSAAQCGLLIDQATPEQIAAAIRQLQLPDLRRQLGKNGLRAAQTDFNTAAVERQLIELYHMLTE
ncbi:MAG: glycosyltransferase [Chloroflexi bacterium]|nr:MAG: glycosyltransferase [Chloroflexota bacterium]